MFWKSRKNQAEKDIAELIQRQISTDELTAEFCLKWFEDHRNRNRATFPEWFGVAAPADKRYLTDMLGYEYPDGFESENTAVLFITDKFMKHMYAHTLVKYDRLGDTMLSEPIAQGAMVRFNFN